MDKIVGVKFDSEAQLKYYLIGNLKIKKNQTVIANTDKGLELGKVITDIHPIDIKKLNNKLPQIIRISTKEDYLNYKENKKIAGQALRKCQKLVNDMGLNMNVIESFFTLNKDHLIFNFYADNRVDFRELAKELSYIYKTRIELRQIGVRDKSKKISGIGSCGQELCCAKFLDKFDSVTISMAKNQNLSLNPNKINGVCGRLLCCLKYEDECYKQCRKHLPNLGEVVETENGKGVVTSLNILEKKYKIQLENGNIIEEVIKNGSSK